MRIIPCEVDAELRRKIDEFAEVLKVESHTLGNHGLSEKEFYNNGLFRGAIERIRGQFSARMGGKRIFVKHVLNFLQDRNLIKEWESAGSSNRHDYSVLLNSGKRAVIELKGCLDGNNTIIYERPSHAQEFIIWSLCTNPGSDLAHNVWSGIHTRLSADIVFRNQQVDGLIVWDMACGTIGRPCPKLGVGNERLTEVGPYRLPPPCIYVFPATVPSPRNNPHPAAQSLQSVEFLSALHACFGGHNDEVNYVDFTVGHKASETVRKTTIRRAGEVQQESKETPIKRA